jgi:hypothetical protein
MSIDLSSVKAFVEDHVMSDECLVTRDAAGSKDDVWNADTGEYDQAPDPIIVYEGKCYVGGSWQPSYTTEGGLEARIETYFLNIPLEEGPVIHGDRVVITASLRNPHLVDREFLCGGHDVGTHKVKQKIPIQRVMRKGQR